MSLQMNITKTEIYRNENNPEDVVEKQNAYPQAYFQITAIDGDKEKLKIRVTTYNDATKQQVIGQRFYAFTPSVADDSENFIRQGYEYLKTLPEFAGAADC